MTFSMLTVPAPVVCHISQILTPCYSPLPPSPQLVISQTYHTLLPAGPMHTIAHQRIYFAAIWLFGFIRTYSDRFGLFHILREGLWNFAVRISFQLEELS